MKDFKYIAFGITNQCKDNYVLPFFDYDRAKITEITKELRFLQEKFYLSSIYLIKSTHGYNAFSFDKLTFDVLKRILDNTKYTDKQFIKYGLQRGFLTLRMGEDKKLTYILKSYNQAYTKSYAHKWFFNSIMKFNIIDTKNFDSEKQITITQFPSNKHGFLKEIFENEKHI